MKLTVEAKIAASIQAVWDAWVTPEDIMQWNAASDDWHTTQASVDLQVGGKFSYHMAAKDGSMEFDFDGEYTQIEPHKLIACRLGDRALKVEFIEDGEQVIVRETFDAESTHPEEAQRDGWQAILDRFAKHVESK